MAPAVPPLHVTHKVTEGQQRQGSHHGPDQQAHDKVELTNESEEETVGELPEVTVQEGLGGLDLEA